MQFFHRECEPLKKVFARLYYPETLVKNTISRHFIETKFTENACLTQRVSDELDDPVRIGLTFQRPEVRHQRSDLSRKIDVDVQPVYTSQKIKGQFKPKDHKTPIVNQQNVVYYFNCGLCDADYVGFRSRHLHKHVEEYKRSTIGSHVKYEHGKDPGTIRSNFKVLKSVRANETV